jgi:hypothetical protein
MIRKILFKTLLGAGLLSMMASCATTYHPNSFSGGYSESRLAPNVALVTFRGNGFTSALAVQKMALLRAAEVTAASGYRYFVITGTEDDSSTVAVTLPGYANTSLSYGYGYGFANTSFMPAQTFPVVRPAVSFMVRMSNSQRELAGFMHQIYDANYLQASLRT